MPRKKMSVRIVYSPKKASNRPAKLRNWRDEAMTGAIEAVKGGMGVNRAAKEFGVPTTMLRDRLSGRVTHGTNPGPKPYLSSQEEGELTEYLASTSKAGYGKTRRQVMNIVQHVRKKARVVNERAHETSTIDINQCCVCFIHYQDDVAEANGRNWIACSCGRWLHEDCSLIEPEMIPTSEEFCPKYVL